MTDDELRSLVAALLDGDGAAAASRAATRSRRAPPHRPPVADLEALEAWVIA